MIMERIEQLTEFLKESPEDSFLQHALALEHAKRGQDAQARRLFEQLLERDPGYVGSYYHLGKLLQRLHEPAAALRVYKKGLEMTAAVNDRHTYNELSTALEDLMDETE